MDTSVLDEAIIFATKAHAGTERRGKGFPYIVHPLEAVSIVATLTADQELLAAAALHDVLEDTDVTEDQLRERFGDRVAKAVVAESEVPMEELSRDLLASAQGGGHQEARRRLARLQDGRHGRQALQHAGDRPRP